MTFKQPNLPYDLKALAPFVSEEQMDYHYNKHHASYVTNLNKLVTGKPEAEKSLEDIIKSSSGGVFNNAAQTWNHTFFWNCMSTSGGGSPTGNLKAAIEKDFGSLKAFKEKFSNASATLFGSGWAWLAKDASGTLEIMPLSNADTPLRHNKTPILTLDVWEHAYYIDYRNRRPNFIEGFWDVINWDFISASFS